MALLEIANLSLRFGGVSALQEVSFAVAPGELAAIIGPNGAGTTGLLNCISGVYRPQQGSVRFDGRDVTRMKPSARTRLGIARTFHNIALVKGMTVLDNLLIGRHWHQKTGVLAGGLYYGLGQREELRDRELIEEIMDFVEMQPVRKQLVPTRAYALPKRAELDCVRRTWASGARRARARSTSGCAIFPWGFWRSASSAAGRWPSSATTAPNG